MCFDSLKNIKNSPMGPYFKSAWLDKIHSIPFTFATCIQDTVTTRNHSTLSTFHAYRSFKAGKYKTGFLSSIWVTGTGLHSAYELVQPGWRIAVVLMIQGMKVNVDMWWIFGLLLGVNPQKLYWEIRKIGFNAPIR